MCVKVKDRNKTFKANKPLQRLDIQLEFGSFEPILAEIVRKFHKIEV